jgi:hypothetical protein
MDSIRRPLDTPLDTPLPRTNSWKDTWEAHFQQARMTRGIHGLPKVSPGAAMADPSTLCGQATPETTLRSFLGWPACRAGGLWPSSIPLDTLRRTGLRTNS